MDMGEIAKFVTVCIKRSMSSAKNAIRLTMNRKTGAFLKILVIGRGRPGGKGNDCVTRKSIGVYAAGGHLFWSSTCIFRNTSRIEKTLESKCC